MFTFLSETWHVARYLDELPADSRNVTYSVDEICIVVPDETAFDRWQAAQEHELGENANRPQHAVYFNLTGSDREQLAYEQLLNRALGDLDNLHSYYYVMRAETAQSQRAFNGGFLFLGLFLGCLFLLATVLIIYYKQVSEGYEDRQRFAILQKVGMSRQEVRASIRSQIVTVFFLPLVMAAIHILAAFNMIRRLLYLFSLTDWVLFACWYTASRRGPITALCAQTPLPAEHFTYHHTDNPLRCRRRGLSGQRV